MKSPSFQSGWRPVALAAAACLLLAPAPVFAGTYWEGLKRYWSGFVGNANGVVVTALVVGLISLFIITRGKWNK